MGDPELGIEDECRPRTALRDAREIQLAIEHLHDHGSDGLQHIGHQLHSNRTPIGNPPAALIRGPAALYLKEHPQRRKESGMITSLLTLVLLTVPQSEKKEVKWLT